MEGWSWWSPGQSAIGVSPTTLLWVRSQYTVKSMTCIFSLPPPPLLLVSLISSFSSPCFLSCSLPASVAWTLGKTNLIHALRVCDLCFHYWMLKLYCQCWSSFLTQREAEVSGSFYSISVWTLFSVSFNIFTSEFQNTQLVPVKNLSFLGCAETWSQEFVLLVLSTFFYRHPYEVSITEAMNNTTWERRWGNATKDFGRKAWWIITFKCYTTYFLFKDKPSRNREGEIKVEKG